MKTELSLADLPNDRQENVEKMLGLCLTKEKLRQIERCIGADFDRLKQTLVGCFVRVPVQGRPMLAAIKSVEDHCQIEWARFKHRLFLPSLGYFEFGQVHPEMPSREEMQRWCQRREQKALGPTISDKFIVAKLALLNSQQYIADVQAADDADSDQLSEDELQEEEEENEANCFVKAEEEFPELPNVEGLIQNRELLAQVLLPCDMLLESFSIHVKNKVLSRATTGCLMAFRIGSEEENSEINVDEIGSIKKKQNEVHFKLGQEVNVSDLVPVDEGEITDHIFDQWLQRLAIKNEPVPEVQAKYKRKAQAIDRLAALANWTKQLESLGKLPDIARIAVTGKELRLLTFYLEPDELNRVLTGCFVSVKKHFLKLEKQPYLSGIFVVPIAQIDVNRTEFYLDSRIPVRHKKTGQQVTGIALQNVCDQQLNGQHKLVLQCLLMMAELNIPLPSDEDVARKWAQLNDALMKARCRSRQLLFSSSSSSSYYSSHSAPKPVSKKRTLPINSAGPSAIIKKIKKSLPRKQ